MRPLGLTGNALALALRVPPSRINGIINGGRAVSDDTALRLARYFDTSPEFWLYMQAGMIYRRLGRRAASGLPPKSGRTADGRQTDED